MVLEASVGVPMIAGGIICLVRPLRRMGALLVEPRNLNDGV